MFFLVNSNANTITDEMERGIMKMRKAVLRSPGELEIMEMDASKCADGGVVVKVQACTICGTDVENYLHGQRMSQLPPDLGHELTGIVSMVGR